MTISQKESENPPPNESFDNLLMLAEVCWDVLEGKQTLPREDEKPVLDLVNALKSAPVAFEYPTKRRGTPGKPHCIKKQENVMIKTAATDKTNDLPVLPPKKRSLRDVDKEDRKILIGKKSGSTLSRRRRLDAEEIGIEVMKRTKTKNSGKRGVIAGPDPAPSMPDDLMEMVVRDFDASTMTLVVQKSLFQTDLEKVENRLLMTLKQIASDDFLTEKEKRTLATRRSDKRLEDIEVDFIEPDKDLSKTKMMLKKWDLKSSCSYVLSYNWHNVVKRNNLKVGDIVQIWFFRSRKGKPCFAVVNLGQEPASCPSSAGGKDDREPRSDVDTA